MSRVLKYQEVMNKVVEMTKKTKNRKCPSIRTLSELLKCSRGTIIKAYKELENQNIVYTLPQSGTYLVPTERTPLEKNKSIDFITAVLEPKLRPHKAFEHYLSQAIKGEFYGYTNVEGLYSLRKSLVEHLEYRQIFVKEDQLMVTSGAQQALYLTVQLIQSLKLGTLAIEQPAYGEFQRLLESTEIPVVTFDRNNQGINFKQLTELLHKEPIKWLYTIPNYQNPLGTSLSVKDKQQLIKLAEKYDFYIIEDDYIGDLNLNLRLNPIHYYDVHQRVIYISSFSKSFLPGIRLGILIAPDQFRERLFFYKKAIDLNTCILSQGGLEHFLNSGLYNKHILKVRRALKKKLQCFMSYQEAFNRYDCRLLIPNSGIFIWLDLPDDVPSFQLVNALEKRKILVTDSSHYFMNKESKRNGIRFCFSSLSEEEILRGLKGVIETIDQYKTFKM